MSDIMRNDFVYRIVENFIFYVLSVKMRKIDS